MITAIEVHSFDNWQSFLNWKEEAGDVFYVQPNEATENSRSKCNNFNNTSLIIKKLLQIPLVHDCLCAAGMARSLTIILIVSAKVGKCTVG